MTLLERHTGFGRVAALALLGTLAVAPPSIGQEASPTPIPSRAGEMQHHFGQLTRLHEALIRGDLRGMLRPAADLATADPPEGFPALGQPFMEDIRRFARRAGTAPNLRTAAAETINITTRCAACHQAAGVFPSPASPRRPDLPLIVGHMLEHQQAADDLLQGLVMPSNSRWMEGADRLDRLLLAPGEWPADPRLTNEAKKADAAVHALASRARRASSASARAGVYADLVTTCASCHSLHRTIWGPQSGR